MTGQRKFSTISLIFCFVLTAGCMKSPDLLVQVIRYPGFVFEGGAPDCEEFSAYRQVRVFKSEKIFPGECHAIGDVFIGDSGATFDCEPEDLIRRLRIAACEKGVVLTRIIHINPPRGGSSCHQLRAALIACD